MSPWTLRPGESIKRTRLHELFGGGGQGGISPSARTKNVLILSDAKVGAQHGYVDDWQADGSFHYTGEGQRGDQQMIAGNAAILNHVGDGRALRVFHGVRGVVKYVGEFVVDQADPYYRRDAPQTGGGSLRKVIVFRLRPRSISVTVATKAGPREPSVAVVPVENHLTDGFTVEPPKESYEARRREAALATAFRNDLVAQGHDVQRLVIRPAGETTAIWSDLYVPATGLLVEAKGSVGRAAIRMAIGQLIDYRRFVEKPQCAVLLPERPTEDLLELLAAARIAVYIPDGSGFEYIAPKT